jgi:anti-sigma-K factor RskA
MSLSRETMLELMAYADGELDAADAARIEALIAKDEDARRVVESFGGSIDGDDTFAALLTPSFEAAADAANVDAIADAVMTRIAGEAMQPKVASINAARAKRAARVRATFAIGAAFAIAASAFFIVRSQRSTAPSGDNNVANVAVKTANAGSPDDVEREDSIQIDEVDTPAKDVSVYYVKDDPGADDSCGVVIWVGGAKPAGGK